MVCYSLESDITKLITEVLPQLKDRYMPSYSKELGDESELLLVGEVEGNVERWKDSVHTPDQDYVQEGSCHTCLPHRPGLCLSGQHYTHMDSCPSHSVFLENDAKHTKSHKTTQHK